MSGTDRFDARVAQLGEADEMAGDARIVARAGGEAGAVTRAVLNAVDETILPAELAFASEAGETLVLSVAARRLRSVVSASDDLSSEDVRGRELEADEEAGLRAALDLIDRFARGTSGAVIVSERRAEESAARGVAATRLIDMLPADAPEAAAAREGDATTSAADTLLAAGGDRILASLVRAPAGADVTHGDAALAATLAALAEGAPRGAGPVLDLWMRQSGEPDAPALARAIWADGTVAVLALAPGDVAPLAAAFRATGVDT